MKRLSLMLLILLPWQAQAQNVEFDPPSWNSLFSPHVRIRLANSTCLGCEERPGHAHFTLDSELLTDTLLNNISYNDSGGGPYNVHERVADFWYNAVHRRLHLRTIILVEVDDPADIKLARAPGTYPNGPLYQQAGSTISGHVGFADWNSDGVRAYYAAAQGLTDGNGVTGSYLVSLASGQSGQSNLGSGFGPEDMLRRVRFRPNGQIDFNYEYPAGSPPPAHQMHALNITGSGGNVLHAVETVQSAPIYGTAVWQGCPAGKTAIGGGGGCDNGGLRASQPINGGWEVVCAESGWNRAYAICVQQ